MIWSQIAKAIEAVPQSLRVGVDYVTTYRGNPVPQGKKSVTLTLTYRSPQCTLRSEQVDDQVRELVESLRRQLGAELRA